MLLLWWSYRRKRITVANVDKKPSFVDVEVALEEALAVGDEEENVLETKNVVDVVAHTDTTTTTTIVIMMRIFTEWLEKT